MELWIDSFRISLIWTLADPAMLGQGRVGAREGYVSNYEMAPDDPGRPPLVRPWHQRGGFSRFWAYYLGLDYQTAPAARAWNRLVPVRRRRGLSPEGANEPRLWLYAWPHAVASVLEIEVEAGGLALDAAINTAIAKATMERYRYVPGPDRDPDLETIEGNASEIVRIAAEDWLRHLGGHPRSAARPDRPFVVSSVLRGFGSFEIPEDGDAPWRGAYALACLNPRWTRLSLRPVAEHRITSRATPPHGGGVYGVARGRVVWLPERFIDADPQDESLYWYHRNLTDLTMQVEGHLALVRWAATRLGGHGLSFEVGELVRHAAQTLMWLYTGDRQSTYRSASARRQIDDDDVAMVRSVCDHFGVVPPAPPQPLAPVVRQSPGGREGTG